MMKAQEERDPVGRSKIRGLERSANEQLSDKSGTYQQNKDDDGDDDNDDDDGNDDADDADDNSDDCDDSGGGRGCMAIWKRDGE